MKNAITLLNWNMKGGVGKTTLTACEAYELAKQNKKILLVDFDPQGNLTQMMSATFKKKFHPTIPLFKGLANMNLTKTVVHASDYIDIMPTDSLLMMWFSTTLPQIARKIRPWILNHLLKPFKHSYDYIFVDVPPTINEFVLNAIFAADGISIVLQTQEMSYNSSIISAKQLIQLRKQYKLSFRFLGVVLYLFNNAKVDRDITRRARKVFNGAIYANTIKTQERVKGFTATGIREKDHWDKRAIKMYANIVNELKYRVNEMIKHG